MNYKGSCSYTAEERIKLANEDKKDRLYEPKQNQKAIKVLTVAAYVLCVSLAAIMLSSYYIFIWNPTTKPHIIQQRISNCDKIVIPESLSNRLANATEISLETFLKNYSMRFKLDREKPKMIQIEELRSYPNLFERIEQSTLNPKAEIMNPELQSVTTKGPLPSVFKQKSIEPSEFENESNESNGDDENDNENDDNDNDDDVEIDDEDEDVDNGELYGPILQRRIFRNDQSMNNDTGINYDQL